MIRFDFRFKDPDGGSVPHTFIVADDEGDFNVELISFLAKKEGRMLLAGSITFTKTETGSLPDPPDIPVLTFETTREQPLEIGFGW